MKATIDRNALDAGLGIVGAVVPSRTPKDILKSVRVTAESDVVVLTATDGSVGIRYAVAQAEVTEPGDLLLPADKLGQIVHNSADEVLAFETEGSGCHIRGRDSHFEVYGQEPEEFPPVPSLEDGGQLTLSAGALGALIDKTVYAAAKENTRYAINGVLCEKKAGQLKLVGTDGRRLALANCKVDKGGEEELRAILPVRTMRIAQRLLGDADSPVVIRISDNQFLMRVGGAHLSSVLVEGNFPSYQEVVPTDGDIKVELETEALLSAVRRAALLTDEDSKGIRLSFTEGELVLSSRTPERGEATIRMPVKYPGVAMDIGFNPTYLADALNVAGSDTITLELKEPKRPGLLRVGQDYLCVVMPVSLS
ncbi:MAG TPA: DNA polymerase III subunit beta [Mycobacterium sp.]|jgi:DNA polymerase-3 subunit beta